MNKNSSQRTKIIVQTGLLIAVALVLKFTTSFYIPIAGAPAMRISVVGPFSNLPGILFGPLIGGIAKGIIDVLGFVMKPTGGYIPWFTVTAILGGIIAPLLWHKIKIVDYRKVERIFWSFFVLLTIIGIVNQVTLLFLPTLSYAKLLSLLGKKTFFVTQLLEIAGVFGILLFLIDLQVKKNYHNNLIHTYFIKLLICVGIAGIIVTTLNTFLLQIFIPALGQKSFMVLWIPRLIEEVFISIYIAYVMSILLNLYQKIFKTPV